MNERQITKAYLRGELSLEEYQEKLREIGTKRYAEIIRNKKHRASMSSSKWS